MADYYPAIPPLTAGLRCACPRCGRGRLFAGYLSLVDRCSVCGLNIKAADSGDGPAVFLIFILGVIGVGVALWIAASFAVPDWVPVVIAGIVVVLLAAVTLRPAKAYVVALQYRYRRDEYDKPA